MNLKKAFALRKHMNEQFESALMYLNTSGNMVNVTERHLKSQADPTATDEVIEQTSHPYKADDVINFASFLFKEMIDLDTAIADAKNFGGYNYDALIAENCNRRRFISALESVNANKNKKPKKEIGEGYRLNANGEQCSFYYPTELEYSAAFECDVSGEIDILRESAETLSEKIDKIMIERIVYYDNTKYFSVGESFSDALNRYLKYES